MGLFASNEYLLNRDIKKARYKQALLFVPLWYIRPWPNRNWLWSDWPAGSLATAHPTSHPCPPGWPSPSGQWTLCVWFSFSPLPKRSESELGRLPARVGELKGWRTLHRLPQIHLQFSWTTLAIFLLQCCAWLLLLYTYPDSIPSDLWQPSSELHRQCKFRSKWSYRLLLSQGSDRKKNQKKNQIFKKIKKIVLLIIYTVPKKDPYTTKFSGKNGFSIGKPTKLSYLPEQHNRNLSNSMNIAYFIRPRLH